jgi:hypothetical protein
VTPGTKSNADQIAFWNPETPLAPEPLPLPPKSAKASPEPPAPPPTAAYIVLLNTTDDVPPELFADPPAPTVTVYEPDENAGMVNICKPPKPPPPYEAALGPPAPPPPPPQTNTSTYFVPDGADIVVDDVIVDDCVKPVKMPELKGEKLVMLAI